MSKHIPISREQYDAAVRVIAQWTMERVADLAHDDTPTSIITMANDVLPALIERTGIDIADAVAEFMPKTTA